MSEKNYLNVHVLMSHSPSCLNRDDMNMQKSAVFGGVRRVRISSQSLKRAMRKSDYYQVNIGRPSIRTRQLEALKKKLVDDLKDDFSENVVSRTVDLVVGQPEDGEATQADAVAPWAASEIARYCRRLEELEAEGVDAKKIPKLLEKESKGFRAAFGQAVDIALSGRMATSGVMTPVDGAMAVAHAITTHAVDADIDWFTAVDDLVEDAGDVGAGHLNTQEFSAGVFYRYASLNIRQLTENLGNIPREEGLKIASHLLRMMATVVPTAKQNSFAAHNVADFVLATFGDMPLSLANAFEKPVGRDRKGGFLAPSINAFEDYWKTIVKGYGLTDRTAAFSLRETDFSPRLGSLADLEAWVAEGGLENGGG